MFNTNININPLEVLFILFYIFYMIFPKFKKNNQNIKLKEIECEQCKIQNLKINFRMQYIANDVWELKNISNQILHNITINHYENDLYSFETLLPQKCRLLPNESAYIMIAMHKIDIPPICLKVHYDNDKIEAVSVPPRNTKQDGSNKYEAKENFINRIRESNKRKENKE